LTFRALGRIHLVVTTITIQAQDYVSIKQLDSPLRHQFHVSCMRVVGCNLLLPTGLPCVADKSLRTVIDYLSPSASAQGLCKQRPECTLPNSLGASSQHNRWSHCIFRRYTTSLPTSLICIASIDQRISSVETCCGASVRWGHRCNPRNLKDVQGAFHLPQIKQ